MFEYDCYMYVLIYLCVFIYMYVCMCVCVYICMCVCTYIHVRMSMFSGSSGILAHLHQVFVVSFVEMQ